jgi:hypothetical protein
LVATKSDILLPDLRIEIAQCERKGKMHDACGTTWGLLDSHMTTRSKISETWFDDLDSCKPLSRKVNAEHGASRATS